MGVCLGLVDVPEQVQAFGDQLRIPQDVGRDCGGAVVPCRPVLSARSGVIFEAF